MKIDKIKKLISVMDEANLEKIKYEDQDFKITLEKNISANKDEKIDIDWITSPLVGVFYNIKPKIKKGQKVKKGEVLCVIDSMKVMNEITSPRDGIIEDINFKDKDKVCVNDKLFRLG